MWPLPNAGVSFIADLSILGTDSAGVHTIYLWSVQTRTVATTFSMSF